MPVIEITDLAHSGVEIFSSLTEAQLRNRKEPEKGIFIVESPKVIRVALDAGYSPVALLCEQKHIEGDASDIIGRCGDIPIFTGCRELLATLTGYTLTRGVLCAMRRPAPQRLTDICAGARRIVVIDGVVDTTNIGAIFRSAAALGIDAVLLTTSSCDPLNRRSVRVSMGSVFLVPWTWIEDINQLHDIGFKTVAMALTDNSIPLDSPILKAEDRRRCKLCRTHPNGPWCRLPKRRSSLCRSLLGTSVICSQGNEHMFVGQWTYVRRAMNICSWGDGHM